MPFLFIGTTGDHAGHSLLTWAIARRLMEKGLRVGFIKPFGTEPVYKEGLWTDRDVLLFKEALRLFEPLDRLCPYPRPEESWGQKDTDEILEEIKSLAEDFSTGKEILLIMGSGDIFFDDPSPGVSDILLNINLKADLALIDRYRETRRSIYSILSVTSLIKDRLKGIVLNRVPPERLDMVNDQMIPFLARKGIPVITAIPEDPLLSFRSLGEIGEILDGELLWGEGGLKRSVGGMTVGSHDLTGGLMLLKRVYNKIILLGPASPENETSGARAHRPIAGIFLTGGKRPAPQVLEAAKGADIPLFLVREDTFKALERLEESTPGLSAGDETKVRRFTDLMDRNGALDGLIRSLGLIP